MKRVLIVGAGSYVGDNVKEYLEQYPDEYKVDVLDARGLVPIEKSFRGYDVIFHVAGIAHIKETNENAHLYYKINRDLAIAVAEKAREAGVGQFIVMSTMAVYGLPEGVIRKDTKPRPKTHYGRSKLEADRAIWKLHTNDFRVAVLRPPMIYGKGCKGNYQKLRWLALHSPVFPRVDNQRSMLYIGNLCCFVENVIRDDRQGLFFPQNAEYVNTGVMANTIVGINKGRMKLMPESVCIDHIMRRLSRKAFGSLVYERTDIADRYSFEESIILTES